MLVITMFVELRPHRRMVHFRPLIVSRHGTQRWMAQAITAVCFGIVTDKLRIAAVIDIKATFKWLFLAWHVHERYLYIYILDMRMRLRDGCMRWMELRCFQPQLVVIYCTYTWPADSLLIRFILKLQIKRVQAANASGWRTEVCNNWVKGNLCLQVAFPK